MSIAQSKEKINRRYFEILFSYLFQNTGFDISCKLSHKETVCMKCQTLFSEVEKNIKLLSVEFALSLVKVKFETIS